uniref:Sulfur globule protein CV1 n=1 Tax=Candidatus Kentrum sp. LFY TaxID=2126342 RepID=A0A450WLS2_9GAMM|nr:MAG: hypothetical protein BECKLFY1418C_GA0070996_103726 [Candidatus Kentron sp. LFY]
MKPISMKLISKTLAVALIVGTSVLPMQAANGCGFFSDGSRSFGPWSWAEYGIGNRGGRGGAPHGYGGHHGYPYGGYGYVPHYGYGFPPPAPPNRAPRKD